MKESQIFFRNILGADTQVLSNKRGRLISVTINRVNAGNGFELRDATNATGGARIANVTLSAADVITTLLYGCNFGSGLTVITTGATLDITVCYLEYDQEGI